MTRTALIIPAAGTGSRFGGERPKQFIDLAGEPVLAHTLRRFAGLVDHAWLAVNDAWRSEVEAIARAAPFPCAVVSGGATRQASVHAALLAVTDDCERILVHDAVRPLVPRTCIEACLTALENHPAAVVAVPCAATVKRASPQGLVAATVPRTDLWLAQTPQGFHRRAGLAAFAAAEADAFDGTDDVQLFERQGLPVALVPGDACNLKLTTRDDLAVALALLAAASA
jgi:2-C-methyl-D-erythritol 4-phosphate cytidylyltransferase/2-C-methyl-D-erythritol 2,4-cyclodiphosphate synthase